MRSGKTLSFVHGVHHLMMVAVKSSIISSRKKTSPLMKSAGLLLHQPIKDTTILYPNLLKEKSIFSELQLKTSLAVDHHAILSQLLQRISLVKHEHNHHLFKIKQTVLLHIKITLKCSGSLFFKYLVFSDPPDAPNMPRIGEVSSSSVALSWHEPKDNGSPILGYWIERREVNSKYWTRVNRNLLSSLALKVDGLMEGLVYVFRVCAENLAGPGEFSVPTDPVVARDPISMFNLILQEICLLNKN